MYIHTYIHTNIHTNIHRHSPVIKSFLLPVTQNFISLSNFLELRLSFLQQGINAYATAVSANNRSATARCLPATRNHRIRNGCKRQQS